MSDSKEMQKLDQCIASVQDSAKELKACMEGMNQGQNNQNDVYSKMGALADNLYASMASMRSTMWDLHDSHASRLTEHTKNHAPAFKSNKHLQNFLKACDMESDYTVSPKELGTASYANMAYASTIKVDKKGMTVEIDFSKPNK